MITAELIDQASRLGLVTQRELDAGWVDIVDQDDERLQTLTVHGHPVAQVRTDENRMANGALERERLTLLAMADLDGVPAALGGSPGVSVWSTVLAGRPLGEQSRTVAEYAEIAQAWGSMLARLHTYPIRVPGPCAAPRPQLLDVRALARIAKSAGWESPPATVLHAYLASNGLRAAAVEVAERWDAQQWIHGNLTPRHVLVAERPTVRIGLIGLCRAGLGDPAWDIAAAIEVITRQSVDWHAPAESLIEYFLQGYRHVAIPPRLYPGIQALAALNFAWDLATRPSPRPDDLTYWIQRSQLHADRAPAHSYSTAA